MKPTSFKPTTIPQSETKPNDPEEPKASFKPTSWESKVPPPEVKPVHQPIGPSKLPGQERHTLDVSFDEVKKKFIAYDDDIIQATRDTLCGVIIESMDTQATMMFGVKVQQSYSIIVDKWLKVLEGDQVRTTGRHVQRLKEVLQTVADSLTAGQPWFRRETIQGRFDKVKPEIEQLRQLLRTGEQQLSVANRELTELKLSTQRLIKEATGYMLACEYIIPKLPEDKGRLLNDRGMSLTKTISLLQTQAMKLDQDEQNITALLTNIQDGVLIALPALLSTVATAVQDEKNDTQRFVVRDQLMDVIRKLT